jgi:hypothetical protein
MSRDMATVAASNRALPPPTALWHPAFVKPGLVLILAAPPLAGVAHVADAVGPSLAAE